MLFLNPFTLIFSTGLTFICVLVLISTLNQLSVADDSKADQIWWRNCGVKVYSSKKLSEENTPAWIRRSARFMDVFNHNFYAHWCSIPDTVPLPSTFKHGNADRDDHGYICSCPSACCLDEDGDPCRYDAPSLSAFRRHLIVCHGTALSIRGCGRVASECNPQLDEDELRRRQAYISCRQAGQGAFRDN